MRDDAGLEEEILRMSGSPSQSMQRFALPPIVYGPLSEGLKGAMRDICGELLVHCRYDGFGYDTGTGGFLAYMLTALFPGSYEAIAAFVNSVFADEQMTLRIYHNGDIPVCRLAVDIMSSRIRSGGGTIGVKGEELVKWTENVRVAIHGLIACDDADALCRWWEKNFPAMGGDLTNDPRIEIAVKGLIERGQIDRPPHRVAGLRRNVNCPWILAVVMQILNGAEIIWRERILVHGNHQEGDLLEYRWLKVNQRNPGNTICCARRRS
jgi:hypothetical protein